MSKYSPLTDHLAAASTSRVPMSFREIEAILGFPLPPSARRHRAWWSNNGSNNVMTLAWKAAGYETSEVDMERHRLVFRRSLAGAAAKMPPSGPALRDRRADPDANRAGEAASPPPPRADAPRTAEIRHPAFGLWKGLVSLADGVDLTAPADPAWADRATDP